MHEENIPIAPSNSESPVLCRYMSPADQLLMMRKLREERPWTYKWRLTEADFRQAEASMPKGGDFGLPETAVIQLVPYLDGNDTLDPVRRTFRDLWSLARSNFPEYHCDVLVDCDGTFDGLTLMPGLRHRPGLRWEIIDLEANLLGSPLAVRNIKDSPHAGVLAIAAFQPEVLKAVRHAVVISGYELRTVLDFDFRLPNDPVDHDEERRPIKGSVICLSCDRDDPGLNLFSMNLGLNADATIKKNPNFNWVVPARLR